MSVCHVMINCTLKIIIFPAEKPQFTQHILVRQCPLTFHCKCMLSCITIGSATQCKPYPLLVGSGSTHYVQICTSYDLSRSFVGIKKLYQSCRAKLLLSHMHFVKATFATMLQKFLATTFVVGLLFVRGGSDSNFY